MQYLSAEICIYMKNKLLKFFRNLRSKWRGKRWPCPVQLGLMDDYTMWCSRIFYCLLDGTYTTLTQLFIATWDLFSPHREVLALENTAYAWYAINMHPASGESYILLQDMLYFFSFPFLFRFHLYLFFKIINYPEYPGPT